MDFFGADHHDTYEPKSTLTSLLIDENMSSVRSKTKSPSDREEL